MAIFFKKRTKLNLRNATLEFGKKGGTGFARLSSEEAAQEAVPFRLHQYV